jgi:hypothetical protein
MRDKSNIFLSVWRLAGLTQDISTRVRNTPVRISPHLYRVVAPLGINVRPTHLYRVEPPRGTNVRHLYQVGRKPGHALLRGHLYQAVAPTGKNEDICTEGKKYK